jgi:hypothetical protein
MLRETPNHDTAKEGISCVSGSPKIDVPRYGNSLEPICSPTTPSVSTDPCVTASVAVGTTRDGQDATGHDSTAGAIQRNVRS